MELLYLLKKEIKQPLTRFVVLILITGISNAMLIEIINMSAAHIVDNESNGRYFMMYMFCFIFVLTAKKTVYDKAFEMIEGVVNTLRKRIAYKIGQAELSTFEKIGAASFYTRLTQDVLSISKVAWDLVATLQSLTIILFMLVYISILSGWACIAVLIGISMSILNYTSKSKEILDNFAQLSHKETLFFEQFNQILQGFKEIKLNEKKRRAVFERYIKINDDRKKCKVETYKLYNFAFISSQMFLYSMIGLIIFIIPQYDQEHAGTIIKITAAILFILGPIESVLGAIGNLSMANDGTKNILKLERDLDGILKTQERAIAPSAQTVPLSFSHSIELEGLMYEYDTNDPAHAFRVGPMNLTIKKGEVIFITGGNGAGKSTFLKLLTGLYRPKQGRIYIDRNKEAGIEGTPINATNYNQYGELFGLIFTDFHLFDKLYGVESVDPRIVNTFLQRMGLSKEKTTYRNGRFSNIKLSSGQKKRLALITSILEDKDLFIFDEVAADLDPDFRDVYYHELLSELKARNKTVLVVSHDKSYWHVADRVLLLKKGQFQEIYASKPNLATFI